MVNGVPLFTGTSDDTQLDIIFRHLGTPDDNILPGMSELPNYKKDFPKYPILTHLNSLVPTLDEVGVDLISSMLAYDPMRRITAQDARNHAFFKDLSVSLKKVGDDML
jgi:serine/threonine protein kinase